MQHVGGTVSNQNEDKYNWSGVLETASGIAFDVYNPTEEMVTLEDIARSLSLICRYNGHLPKFYSVAEHSVRVAWRLQSICSSTREQLGGLLHDAAEAYVGDMVRPLKRHGELGYHHSNLELGVMQVISNKFNIPFPLPKSVHEADKYLYYWEVENIRTGKYAGWDPDSAYDAFMRRFQFLTEDIK